MTNGVTVKKITAQGFSLVELMVAIVLGLILTLGVTQVFLGNRQTQTMEESLGRVQESGRLALEFISADLRLVGFMGSGELPRARVPIMKPSVSNVCLAATRKAKSDILNVANNYDWYDEFTSNAIRAYTKSAVGNSWSPSIPPSTATGGDISATAIANARNGSDLIALWYAEDTGAEVLGNSTGGKTATGTDKVKIRYSAGDLCFDQGELAVLSHPKGSVLFRVTNSAACTGDVVLEHEVVDTSSDPDITPDNCTASLGINPYDEFSRVMKLQHRVYYVADTGRDNAQGDPIFALRRVTNASDDVELVEGIEFLKLSYGEVVVNGSGVATGNVRYVQPGSVIKASGIASARIGVLVQGSEAVRTENDLNAYELLPDLTINKDGSGIDHGGGRTLRRAFVANVELRNRAE